MDACFETGIKGVDSDCTSCVHTLECRRQEEEADEFFDWGEGGNDNDDIQRSY